jgi:hypothetical protein
MHICARLTDGVCLLYSSISGDECEDLLELNFCGVTADMRVYIHTDWHGKI